MSKPKIIEATYRIVTPMFIGDVEKKASGITPASVKGALRFWWRALNWGRIRDNKGSDAEALRALHKEEGELLGSVGNSEKGGIVGGQGRFFLRVTLKNEQKWQERGLINWAKYLLGQGFRDGLLRNALLGDLYLTCVLKPKISQEQSKQLMDAILALGMFGGLGARARKGFGALAIQSLKISDEEKKIPQNKNDYIGFVKKLAEKYSWKLIKEKPPFTAFCAETRIDVSVSGTNPMGLLDEIGKEQQLYRSWGRNGKVNGIEAERNFEEDHDLVLGVINGKEPKTLPKRIVFGLPHNYYFSSANSGVDIAPKEESRTRRASPLFIHVHQFTDNSSVLIQSLFPATFLPEGTKVQFKSRSQNSFDVTVNDETIDWDVIYKYLDRDRFSAKETIL
ncbi:type III-B CRISPR module RAMP protein Cmr1 [bacterium]|nr:type III-B CRISPR module RAMP protein Cmr1 [bacterium]